MMFHYKINENTAAAKKYVVHALGTKEIKGADTEEKIFSNPAVKRIFALTENYPNFVLPFLKFHFEHGALISSPRDNPTAPSLETLLDILKNKKQLFNQLEHKDLDYYVNLKSIGNITGFEQLFDAIRTIDREREAKWFVEGLPKNLRDQYRALAKDEKAKVITLAANLSNLANEIGKPVVNRLFEKIKRFSNWKISEVISYCSDYVKGYQNLQFKKLIDDLTQLEPEAGLLYMDDRYLAMSMRTEIAQKKLCAIANWCINTGSFHTYAENGHQINIFDFGLDPSDPMFLTGTTIYYAGEVRTSHDINDRLIVKSKNPIKHLITLGYPQKMVNAIISQLSEEEKIKRTVYNIFRSDSAEKILVRIIQQSYVIDLTSDPESIEIITKIVQGRIKSELSREKIVKLYVKYGVTTIFAAHLLKLLIGNPTLEEKSAIINSTLETFKQLNYLTKDVGITRRSISNVLAQEKDVLKELGYTGTNESLRRDGLLESFNEFIRRFN